MLVPCWSGSSRGVVASLRGRCKLLDWRAAVSSNERRQPSLSELWSEERVRDRATPIHSKHALCSVVDKSNHTITTTVSKLNFNCVCIKMAVVGIGEGRV